MSETQAEYKVRIKRGASSLLLNEPPLQVLPSLAVAIGLEEAIFVQQLHYWLSNPKVKGRIDEYGNKWIYNSYSEWAEDNFPFWSEQKIGRIVRSAEEQSVVICEQLNAMQRDQTKFYRIDYEALNALLDALHRSNLNDGAFKSKRSHRSNLNDVKMNQRLPETTSGADAPNLPIDWQIAVGEEIVQHDQFDAQARDAASLIDFQCAGAGDLALAFMRERRILIPQSRAKGNRKAAREMLEMGVKPEHVTEATHLLIGRNMTVTDLFSVVRTAIDIANKPPEAVEMTRLL